MAHPPEVKAAVVADLLAGMGTREAERKHGIHQATISVWNRELVRTSQDPSEARRERFFTAVESMFVASAKMLERQATMLSDPELWKGEKSERRLAEWRKLAELVSERSIRILDSARGVPNMQAEPDDA